MKPLDYVLRPLVPPRLSPLHPQREGGICLDKSLIYGQFTLSYLDKLTTVSFTSCFAPLSQKKEYALLNSITEAN